FPFPPPVIEPPPDPAPPRPVEPPPARPGETTPPRPITPPAPIPQPPSLPQATPDRPWPDTPQDRSIWDSILDIFSRLSIFNNDDRRTVLVLKLIKAREYRRSPALEFEALRDLQWKDVTDICGKQFERLQRLVNAAYNVIKSKYPNLTGARLGSAVHREV